MLKHKNITEIKTSFFTSVFKMLLINLFLCFRHQSCGPSMHYVFDMSVHLCVRPGRGILWPTCHWLLVIFYLQTSLSHHVHFYHTDILCIEIVRFLWCRQTTKQTRSGRTASWTSTTYKGTPTISDPRVVRTSTTHCHREGSSLLRHSWPVRSGWFCNATEYSHGT